MKWLTKFDLYLYKFEFLICSISLIIVLFGMSFSVAIRFFNLQIPNTGELALAAASPLVFVGSAMCTRTANHITIDVIDQYAKGWFKYIANILVAISVIVFAVVYVWLSNELLNDAFTRGERWLDMGTPIYIPIFFYLLGMVCMVFHGVLSLVNSIGQINKKKFV